MNYNTEEINQLIKNRRSVFPKQYTGNKVDDDIVKQILENANWAPTHGKTEPWRFFVFTGDGLKSFSKFQSDLYAEKTKAAGTFDENKFQKLLTHPLSASHIVAIVMRRQETERIPEIEEVEAVACAVQNMYLTATAYGLGAYWASGGVTYWEEAKEFFGLGDKDKLLGFFYIGEKAIEVPEGVRGPVENKTTWITE
ncbi:nitroreductase family protein [Chondrinema litorale]|uniref:nitroreductase family protein n=1 Tax=Chondrinema litorale TaxID=2994555 RepID=UPI0025427F6B|nr:nitroreductase [Chondrinema litorale]UZR93111.1 nitroreductase [Chondrinema litorale]